MPRKKTRPNYRRELEKAVERETHWLHLLDEAADNIGKTENELRATRDEIDGYRLHAGIMRAQINALDDHVDALSQRYVGVKLDTQQFTFGQAGEWLKNERVAVTGKVAQIRRQMTDSWSNGARSADPAIVGVDRRSCPGKES